MIPISKQELDAFQSALEFPSDDILSLKLDKWFQRFKVALQTQKEEEVAPLFLRELQEITRDATEHQTPLEEVSYLCTDGYTYGEQALFTYLHAQPGVSPADPNFTKPFAKVCRHKLGEFALSWLSRRRLGALPSKSQEGALRRVLRADFISILSVVEEHPALKNDPMTRLICNWIERFQKALRGTIQESALLNDFIPLLQAILRDPTESKAPLEEVCYLGSDGQVYGEKALCVHLSLLAKEYKGRSPFSPQEEQRLVVERHPVAEEATKWLKKHGGLSSSSFIDEQVRQLKKEKKLARVPTKEYLELLDEARRLREERNKVEEESKEEVEAKRAAAQIDRDFIGPLQRLQCQTVEEQATASRIREEDLEHLERLKKECHYWNDQIREADENIHQLTEELNDINAGLTQNEREVKELKLSVEQTKKEIAEREAARADSLLVTIGLCIVSIGISLASGGSMSVVPTPDGAGASGFFKWAF